MYFINVPSYVHKIIELIKSALSDKMKSQIEVHKDDAVLKRNFNLNIFPKEYGGLVRLESMVDQFKFQIKEQHEAFLALDKLQINASQLSDGDVGKSECEMLEGFSELGID